MAETPNITGLALLLWSVDPREPERCATPFMHAAAAAALDIEVEVHFAARSVLLLRRGEAERLFAAAEPNRSVREFMCHAHAHGARFLACSASLAAHGLERADLIDEVAALAGASSFIVRALDPAWRALVF